MRKRDVVKEIIFFLIVTAVAYAWWTVMLLLVSFLTLSLLHFTMEGILILAGVGTAAVDAYHIVKKVKK